jgi:elongin-C
MQSSGIVLEKVCEYFYYFVKHKEAKDVADMDFPIELSLELLMAADYLDSMSMRHTIGYVRRWS